MSKIFVLKASKSKLDFFMSEPTEFLYFYCPSLRDLRATLRCITAKGYKIPKEPTLSKRIKEHSGHLILLNPFFQTKMYEIIEIKKPLKVIKELEYKNSFGFTHKLKIADYEINFLPTP